MLKTVMSDIRTDVRVATATYAGRLSQVVDKVSEAVAEAVLNAGIVPRAPSRLAPVRVRAHVPARAR